MSSSQPRYRWYHKVIALLSAVLIMEVGIFLLVYPWFDEWNFSYFSYISPQWDRIWDSAYFRGAVSGVGLVNIYIAFSEVLSLRRFSQPAEEDVPQPNTAGPSDV